MHLCRTSLSLSLWTVFIFIGFNWHNYYSAPPSGVLINNWRPLNQNVSSCQVWIMAWHHHGSPIILLSLQTLRSHLSHLSMSFLFVFLVRLQRAMVCHSYIFSQGYVRCLKMLLCVQVMFVWYCDIGFVSSLWVLVHFLQCFQFDWCPSLWRDGCQSLIES